MKKSFLWILIGATVASFLLRLASLSQTPFANGWDSYFYLIQLQSLVEKGQMHSEEWTILYPLLYLLNLIFDYVIATKVLSCLLAACFTTVLGLIAYINNKSIISSCLILSLTLFSPELTYFTAQWPKNLLGIDLFLLLFLFLTKRQFKWALVFLVLGLFGHRLTAILSILVFSGWYIFEHLNFKIIGISLLVFIVLLSIIQLFPGLISIYDYGRLADLLGQSLIIAPQEFLKLFNVNKVSTFWRVELWVYFLTFLLLGVKFVYDLLTKTYNKSLILIFVVLLVLWFPFYHFTLDGAAYRFYHAGVLISFLIPAILLPKSYNHKIIKASVITLSCILMIISLFSYTSYDHLRHDPPYNFYATISQQISTDWSDTDPPELIIAHKSLAEFITFSTRVDAMPWLPEYEIADDRLYRIGYFPLKQLAKFYLDEKVTFLLSNYGYLQEKDWNFYLQELEANENRDIIELHLDWKNPSQIRPSYLLNN